MRTRRLLPPPFTSTSTTSSPSDCATRCATSSIFDATSSPIVADFSRPTKKWAFAHLFGLTIQLHCSVFVPGRKWVDVGEGTNEANLRPNEAISCLGWFIPTAFHGTSPGSDQSPWAEVY